MRLFYAFVFAILLLTAACGGSEDDSAATTPVAGANTTATAAMQDKTGVQTGQFEFNCPEG